MIARIYRWLPCCAGLLVSITGCQAPRPTAAVPPARSFTQTSPAAFSPASLDSRHQQDKTILQTSFEQPLAEQDKDKPKPPLGERLQLPADLPGRDAPVITLPELKPGNEEARKAAIDRHFPALPPLPDLQRPQMGPDGKPLGLADLQQMARANSPLLRQAFAAVETATGAAIQAGLRPNPTVGYVGDDFNQANTAGKHGAFIDQTIKTGGKRSLSRAAADADVEKAELALRKTEIELLTQVRKAYFNFLVAQRRLAVERAFVGLTQEVYAIQVARLRQGQAAVYEPLQARVQAIQARSSFTQTNNRLLAAWGQLAAALGTPDMKLTALAGNLDQAVPRYTLEAAQEHVLNNHTDVLSAAHSITRAQLLLRLAEVTPFPDLDLHYQAQIDKTASPNNAVHGVSVGVRLPLWDRNQGGIRSAQANLSYAAAEPMRVRNELAIQLATAFERYETSRDQVLMYRDQMVPDQARAYRLIYRRYDAEPEVLNFNDVISAQQTLAETIKSYINSIGNLWEAVADVGNLMQLDDLAAMPADFDQCPIPSLEPVPVPRRCSDAASSTGAGGIQRVGYEVLVPDDSGTPRRIDFAVKDLDNRRVTVPFEIRQLAPKKRPWLNFKIVPLQDDDGRQADSSSVK